MNPKLRSLLLSIIFAACLLAGSKSPATAQGAATADPLSALPTSDVVMFVDFRRIMTEIAPRVLAKDPATLAKMMGQINELNQKTGVNLLSIESISAGLQFVGPTTHQMKKDNLGLVFIVRGDVDADKLVAFLKQESKGKGTEETYGGKVIHVEPRPAPPAKKTDRETAALSILDAHTVVVGDLPQVRAAIDAAAGKGRVDPALVQLARRDASAFIGAVGNIPADLIKDLQATAPQDEEDQAILKIVMNVKQVFASLGSTPATFDLTTGARMGTPEQAQSASDLLLGLRQQAVAGVDVAELRDLINSLQISAQGDEVQIKANVKNEDVQDFIASMVKDSGPKSSAKTPAKATSTARRKPRARRGRRRTRH